MNRSRVIGLLAASMLITGCAGLFNKEPIVDLKGVDQQVYAADLSECRAYADSVQVDRGVLVGAATGAVVGGAVGAVAGNSSSAKRTAGIGGIFGGVS
ncbi:MAG TPA: hypothetical protein VNR18_11125, partial [Hyphomicrobiales bacterium]|nr:hypothetical protein [Hyphomicrobiales bacterium]